MGASPGIGAIAVLLQLAAFVFLLFVTISSPVTQVFKLSTTPDFYYGIFGYCETAGSCNTASYPMVPSEAGDDASWAMSDSSRDTLAKILIIAPIATGFTLISLILIIVSLFASHVVGIIGIVVTFIAFLSAAVVCIATIMLFFPHVAWTGWLTVGAAAALLISMLVMVFATKFGEYDELPDDSEDNDLTRLEENFEHKINRYDDEKFIPPQKYDTTVSTFSNDYQGGRKDGETSSIYNPYNKPQKAFDFTQPKNHGLGTNNASSSSIGGSAVATAGNFDRISIVNGPNTPVSSKREMAPSLVPNVATPTTNDVPTSKVPQRPTNNTPLRVNSNNSGPGYPVGGFSPSVFEHHPEVEGHKPFTELTDDQQDQDQQDQQDIPLDSDEESDFTSVSQRAPNPQYFDAHPEDEIPPTPPPHMQPFRPQNPQYYQPQQAPQLNRTTMNEQHRGHPQQPIPHQFSQNQQFQNGQSAYRTPAQHFGYTQGQPQHNPQPRLQPSFNNRSTVQDSVLNANPDFTIVGPGKKQRPGMANQSLGTKRQQGGFAAHNSMARSGPYNIR